MAQKTFARFQRLPNFKKVKNSYSEPYGQQIGNDRVTSASPVTSSKDKAARRKRVIFPPKGRTETVLSSESEQPRRNLGMEKAERVNAGGMF